MAERVIERLGVWSLARVLGVIGLLWSVIAAILFVVTPGMGAPGGAELAVILIVGPLYGVVGGAITGAVYNLAAGVVGGIEIDLV